MKVFFLASARTKELEKCREIYRKISELGHTHTSYFMLKFDPTTFYPATDDVWKERYQSRLSELAKADVCVLEVSLHSIAMGQMVQEAVRREKPVIVLYLHDYEPNFLLGTSKVEKRLQLLEYSPETLDQVLKYGLEIAKELLTTRFTMLMPSVYTKYLDEINSEQGISRSDYIRNLISEDIKRNGK